MCAVLGGFRGRERGDKGSGARRVGVPARKGELCAQGACLWALGTARREAERGVGVPRGCAGVGMLGSWRQRFFVARMGTGRAGSRRGGLRECTEAAPLSSSVSTKRATGTRNA